MIAVVIPAHNEARRLGRCLRAVLIAATQAQQLGHQVEVLVVLDRCSDGSAAVARRFGVKVLEVDAGNVGMARRVGAAHMVECGAQWLACTDADSHVPSHWLVSQLACSAEVVCGTVHVEYCNPGRKLPCASCTRAAMKRGKAIGMYTAPTWVCVLLPINAWVASSPSRRMKMCSWSATFRPVARRLSGPPGTAWPPAAASTAAPARGLVIIWQGCRLRCEKACLHRAK